jgi:peptide/nickel transport system substrate-binding protein
MPLNIDRRTLLKASAATALITGAGPALAGSHGPKMGGTLRLGLSGGNTTDSWDGRTHSDVFMQVCAMGSVFDCLTEVSADGSLAGELAESWTASADAKTWTFNLKKGVTFHNGKAFGADDVIESLQMHVAEGAKSPAKPIVGAVTEMKKMNDHQVQFTLSSGNADFPYLLSDYHILIYPAGMIDEAIRKGIGTGAYMVQSHDPGVRTLMVRNPNAHKKVYFDEVEAISITDPAARINALMTGEVDAISRIDAKSVRLLDRNPSVEVAEVTGNQHYTFPMITNAAPFDNNDIRLAVKHLFNREELVAKILLGHGKPGNDHPIGPANQFYAADLEQRMYDPDKAKFHLKKAGVDSLQIDLSAADAAFAGAVDASVLFQESAKAGGVNINVVKEPSDGYWSNVWMKKPFCACFWSGRATEDWMFSTAYEKGVPWNDSYWEHERFNKILLEARATLDNAKRSEMYREMQIITRDEGGVAIPMYANWIDAKSKKLAHGETVGNLWAMDSARMTERWWFS